MDTEVRTETKHCEIHGDYEAQQLTELGISSLCPECQEEQDKKRQAEEREQQERAKARRVQVLRQNSGVPKRFSGLTLDAFNPPTDKSSKILAACKRYAENFEDRLAMGGGLVLCGQPGTGKTHIACAIADHVIAEHCRTAVFTSIMDMAREVKATYSRDSKRTEAEVIKDYLTPDLLVIDEVGAQRGTETELLLAQEIIDKRYQQVRSTIVISNLPEDELGRYIGERAIDRMYEGGGAVFAFDWDSYRRKGEHRRYQQPEAKTQDPKEFPAGGKQ